jgi:hypothetical protein
MRMIPLSMIVFYLCALGGCSNAYTPYPTDWDPVSRDDCKQPRGSYDNMPEDTSDAKARWLMLKQVFFGDRLNEVVVTHLTFEILETGDTRVKLWTGDAVLDEERVIPLTGKVCNGRQWVVKTGWDVDGYMISSGLLWTGGAIIPAATQVYYAVEVSSSGQLVVHRIDKTGGTLFFLFPFVVREADTWFRYQPLVEID